MCRISGLRAACWMLAEVLLLGGVGCGGRAAGDAQPSYDAGAATRFDSDIESGYAGIDATAGGSGAGADASIGRVDAGPDASAGSDAATADAVGERSDAATGVHVDAGPDASVPQTVVDAAGCSAGTCPAGCCDTNGVCQPGTAINQCGSGGAACQSCLPQGRSGPVDAQCTGQQCVTPPACACVSGCCDSLGACQPGTSNTQCGQATTCVDCTASGLSCAYQRCGFSAGDAGVCNAQTCPSGCCDLEGRCEQGVTDTACGNFGGDCFDCRATGDVCSNQQCAIPAGPAACARTCAGCCDVLGNCSPGTADAQCGESGRRCTDCSTAGDQCQFGMCSAPDGGPTCFATCSGCCDAVGTCQFGFLDTQCGGAEPGEPCQDCTGLDPPSTCDINTSACSSQPTTTCPAGYAGCPAALEEAAPARQYVCSTSELQNVAAVCAGEISTLTCDVDFTFALQIVGAPCFACLQNFAFETVSFTGPNREISHPRSMQSAIRSCAAPYVDATCNHNSACVADCLADTCYDCYTDMDGCETRARSGACAAYFANDQCVTQALGGPAAFCNPMTYQGNLGAWLQAVGTQYCAE
jgi:hypothetical protein